ncbi:MAG TPA: hypothetical protein VM754_08995, partial [Actinomycetota bacterium]|nr:hypothetical protein [Actinomycetota bacterium]
LRNDSQWFDLVPGLNRLTFTRQGTTGISTLTVRHRDAFSTVGAPSGSGAEPLPGVGISEQLVVPILV